MKHNKNIKHILQHKYPENGKPDIFDRDGRVRLLCSFQFQLIKSSITALALSLLTVVILTLFVLLIVFIVKKTNAPDYHLEQPDTATEKQLQNSSFKIDTYKNFWEKQSPIEHEFPSSRALRYQKQFLSILSLVILLLTCSFAFFILYFLLLTRPYSQYLTNIATGINRIADGDFECEIPVISMDEFSLIAGCINEMSEKIQKNIEKERQAEQEKNQLITSVAHDIRTPLTSILGYLELLHDRIPHDNYMPETPLTPQQQHEYIRIAYNKSKRLMTLTEDLFTYTKVSFDQLKMKPAPLNLIMLLDQMIEEFYPSFEDANLVCHFSHADSTIMLEGDSVLLARAFSNLIGNAVKYGHDGKQIDIQAEQTEQETVVTITNYGTAIPQEALSKIFERFYRVENSRSLDTGGSGLGLSIAQRIVTMHHGTIKASSGLEGTSFIVTLPKHNA